MNVSTDLQCVNCNKKQSDGETEIESKNNGGATARFSNRVCWQDTL